MKKKDFQFSIGKTIVYSNGFLFVLIMVLFICRGFLPEELAEIMKFLVPIQSVYMTAMVKFMIENKYVKKEETEDLILTPFYVKLTRSIVFIHLISLTTFIFLKGLGIISMDVLTILIPIIETFFGIYIGGIILDLYKSEKEEAKA